MCVKKVFSVVYAVRLRSKKQRSGEKSWRVWGTMLLSMARGCVQVWYKSNIMKVEWWQWLEWQVKERKNREKFIEWCEHGDVRSGKKELTPFCAFYTYVGRKFKKKLLTPFIYFVLLKKKRRKREKTGKNIHVYERSFREMYKYMYAGHVKCKYV